MVFIDFRLRLAIRGRGCERLGDSLPIHLGGQTNLRIVARIVRFGAVAGRLTATANDSANRTCAHIAQSRELK